MYKKIMFIFILLLSINTVSAQQGNIRGRVVSEHNLQPLAGANVLVEDTRLGAASDSAGYFLIEDVPAGMYTLKLLYMGYQTLLIPDILVRASRDVFVNASLTEDAVYGEAVIVKAGYFRRQDDAPVSVQNLSYEEIRRSPGAREDVSRMLQSLPGVNPVSDDRNDLVIRGGSPTEVLFQLDRIEIPNPNHFGTQGATGGPISMVNIEFIEDVTFMAGGFTAEYGNKVSGVMNISLREGNRHGYNGKLDLNFAGAGGYFEGPISGGRGSFLIGIHRSFLDLFKNVFNYGGVPIYSHLQSKVVFDLNKKHQISALFIGGDDNIHMTPDVKADHFETGIPDTVMYQDLQFKTRQFAAGATLRSLWSETFFTDMTVSHTWNRFFTDYNTIKYAAFRPEALDELADKEKVLDTATYDNTSLEQISTLRFDGTWLPVSGTVLDMGFYARTVQFEHDIAFSPPEPDRENAYGRLGRAFSIRFEQSRTAKYGAYVNLKQRFGTRLTLSGGLRYDAFDLIGSQSVSPRLNVSYDITEKLRFHTGLGRYFQNPELLFITSHPSNRLMLTDIQCDHLIAGLSWMLAPDTRFTFEIYQKEYAHYPVSADEGYEMMSLATAGASYGTANFHEKLTSKGSGRARGIELMLQKKLSQNLYGLIAYTYSEIKARALDGVLRNSSFDNRQIFNFVAGYRAGKKWEFSLKWRYAGGTPYTPYGREASINENSGRLDLSRINTERYAPYHRLDVRVDHRSFFKKGTLVQYISIENVYNRKNPYTHYWNSSKNRTEFHHQIGLFFIGGVSYEF